MLNYFSQMMISRYCSLVHSARCFCEQSSQKTRELSLRSNATSCACHKKVRLSVHREARYGERSERNDLPEAGLQGDFFYGHFEWIRYIM